MDEQVKQEITKNFSKVNDFIVEATKREKEKMVQEGGFLDHSLDALVAKYDIEQQVNTIIKAFESLGKEHDKMKKHDRMLANFRDGGKASGYTLKDFQKLPKNQLVRIAQLQSSMIYVMAGWGWYNSGKESELTKLEKELEEIYNEA